jgi:hypothetical protein
VHEKLYNPLSETFSLCYAAYIAATIQIHILAQHGDHFGAVESLQVCLGCLDRHRAIYSAAKRGWTIITRLMERTGVRICQCGCLAGECPHAAYPECVSSGANQGILGAVEGHDDGQDVAPVSAVDSLPSAERSVGPWDFDADVVFEDFQRLQENSDGRFGIMDYPLFYDLYHSISPEEVAPSMESHGCS